MTILGQDFLAALKYETAMLAAAKPGQCAGIMLRTFGDARKTLEKMCKSGKFSQITVHLASFDNTHAYKSESGIYEDAIFCDKLVTKYGVPLGMSPFCEHNHNMSYMYAVFKNLKAAAPNCFMVNSIWKGAEVPGIITEIHLENSKLKKKPNGEYFVSFDGFGGDGSGDFSDANLPAILNYYSDASQIRGWDFRYNGKFSHEDKTEISKRKAWPSKEYIQGKIAGMKMTREGKITYPKDALMKTYADDHGSVDPTKDNKLMVIYSKKASSIKVYDSKGKQIDTLNRVLPDYSGTPMKGYARYYSKKYAYQIADAAEKNTGSRLIKIDTLPLTDGDLRSSFK